MKNQVALSGKCTLQFDTGSSRFKAEIPKLNAEGVNNADSLIREVLHFGVMRHGVNGLRALIEEKLAKYEACYLDKALHEQSEATATLPVTMPQAAEPTFFAYSSDHGFETYKTAPEAKDAAGNMIDDFLFDGWDEEVNSVCWGEVKGNAVMANKKPAPEGSAFDYICDYVISGE